MSVDPPQEEINEEDAEELLRDSDVDEVFMLTLDILNYVFLLMPGHAQLYTWRVKLTMTLLSKKTT